MSWTVSDAIDYKGFPADKSKTGGWVTAALILGLYHSLPNLKKNKKIYLIRFLFSFLLKNYSGKYLSIYFITRKFSS
jgi:hypothetical protein